MLFSSKVNSIMLLDWIMIDYYSGLETIARPNQILIAVNLVCRCLSILQTTVAASRLLFNGTLETMNHTKSVLKMFKQPVYLKLQ